MSKRPPPQYLKYLRPGQTVTPRCQICGHRGADDSCVACGRRVCRDCSYPLAAPITEEERAQYVDPSDTRIFVRDETWCVTCFDQKEVAQ